MSFGLVNIPVSLHPAESRKELDFTLIDRRDRSPIGYQKINKRTGAAVPPPTRFEGSSRAEAATWS